MRNMIIGLLALACGVSGAYAGYESAPSPKAMKVQAKASGEEVSGIVDRTTWIGGVVMEDGTEFSLQNAGGYFLPIDLEPGVKCQLWFSGAGLIPGRPVTLFTRHGGFINEKVLDEVTVGEDNRLVFEYSNGSMGSQPIHATIFGTTATLMSVVAVESANVGAKEGASREVR